MTDEPTDNDNETTRRTINESADKIRVETTVKRGSDVRNEDKIKVKVKGDDPDDVAEKLTQTVENLRDTADTLRAMQPEEDSDDA